MTFTIIFKSGIAEVNCYLQNDSKPYKGEPNVDDTFQGLKDYHNLLTKASTPADTGGAD